MTAASARHAPPDGKQLAAAHALARSGKTIQALLTLAMRRVLPNLPDEDIEREAHLIQEGVRQGGPGCLDFLEQPPADWGRRVSPTTLCAMDTECWEAVRQYRNAYQGLPADTPLRTLRVSAEFVECIDTMDRSAAAALLEALDRSGVDRLVLSSPRGGHTLDLRALVSIGTLQEIRIERGVTEQAWSVTLPSGIPVFDDEGRPLPMARVNAPQGLHAQAGARPVRAAGAASGAMRRKEVNEDYRGQLTAALGRLFTSATPQRLDSMAQLVQRGACREGADFHFVGKPGACKPMGMNGKEATDVLCHLSPECWELLRRYRNDLFEFPADAPLAALALPLRMARRITRTNAADAALLGAELSRCGVQLLIIPASPDRTQPPDFDVAALGAITSLREIRVLRPRGAPKLWVTGLPPGVTLTDGQGKKLAAGGGHPAVPANAVEPTAPVDPLQLARDASRAEMEEALAGVFDREDQGTIRMLAVELLKAVRPSGLDFTSLVRSPLRDGAPGQDVLGRLDDACWDILCECKQRMSGTPVGSLTLSPLTVTALGTLDTAGTLTALWDQLNCMKVTRLVVPMEPGGTAQLLQACAAIESLAEISVVPPEGGAPWKLIARTGPQERPITLTGPDGASLPVESRMGALVAGSDVKSPANRHRG